MLETLETVRERERERERELYSNELSFINYAQNTKIVTSIQESEKIDFNRIIKDIKDGLYNNQDYCIIRPFCV